tara:strand:- start:760 stop:1866 length:1107 start_codon:yes stop_codon:yes gene_type:complete
MGSNSQLNQDLWVLRTLNQKEEGFFIEIGAANGIVISNTLKLEKEYNWKGLCIEPSTQYSNLVKNRNCICDNNCIGETTGEFIDFIEDQTYDEFSLYSGIEKQLNCHTPKGFKSKKITVSLTTILEQYDCPIVIDYLSIDTEGSEYSILKSFDFKKYTIKCITVEHNFQEDNRLKIRELLVRNGYIWHSLEDSKWDDWYTHKDVKIDPNIIVNKIVLTHWESSLEKKIFQYAFGCAYSLKNQIKFHIPNEFAPLPFHACVKLIEDDTLRLVLNQTMEVLNTQEARKQGIREYNARSLDNIQYSESTYIYNGNLKNCCFEDVNFIDDVNCINMISEMNNKYNFLENITNTEDCQLIKESINKLLKRNER